MIEDTSAMDMALEDEVDVAFDELVEALDFDELMEVSEADLEAAPSQPHELLKAPSNEDELEVARAAFIAREEALQATRAQDRQEAEARRQAFEDGAGEAMDAGRTVHALAGVVYGYVDQYGKEHISFTKKLEAEQAAYDEALAKSKEAPEAKQAAKSKEAPEAETSAPVSVPKKAKRKKAKRKKARAEKDRDRAKRRKKKTAKAAAEAEWVAAIKKAEADGREVFSKADVVFGFIDEDGREVIDSTKERKANKAADEAEWTAVIEKAEADGREVLSCEGIVFGYVDEDGRKQIDFIKKKRANKAAAEAEWTAVIEKAKADGRDVFFCEGIVYGYVDEDGQEQISFAQEKKVYAKEKKAARDAAEAEWAAAIKKAEVAGREVFSKAGVVFGYVGVDGRKKIDFAKEKKAEAKAKKDAKVEGWRDDDSPIVPLPDIGELLPEDFDWYKGKLERPKGGVRLGSQQHRDWLADNYDSAADSCASAYGEFHPDTKFLRNRAEKLRKCGTEWAVRRCKSCGHEEGKKAYIVDPCLSPGCPYCARVKAQEWRGAVFYFVENHPAIRKKGVVSRLYSMDTYTAPGYPYISVPTIRRQAYLVRKGGKNVFDKVGRFLPRKKEVGYGHYPGECRAAPKDGEKKGEMLAGMMLSLEIGLKGNVHGHALYYGPGHFYEDKQRAYKEVVKGAKVFKFKPISGKGKKLAGAVAEVAKYSVKGTPDKNGGEFTHPAVVVMFDLAMHSQRRIECFGSMRGMKKQVEEARKEKRAEQKKKGTLPDEAPCPKCGGDDWEWHERKKKRCWTPDGWGKQKQRGP